MVVGMDDWEPDVSDLFAALARGEIMPPTAGPAMSCELRPASFDVPEFKYADSVRVEGLPGGPLTVVVDDVTTCGPGCEECGDAGRCRSVRFVRRLEDA
jgi:hypothetical protein